MNSEQDASELREKWDKIVNKIEMEQRLKEKIKSLDIDEKVPELVILKTYWEDAYDKLFNRSEKHISDMKYEIYGLKLRIIDQSNWEKGFKDACAFLIHVDEGAVKRLQKKYPDLFMEFLKDRTK